MKCGMCRPFVIDIKFLLVIFDHVLAEVMRIRK